MKLKPTKQQLLRLLPDRIVQTHGEAAGGARYLSFDDGPHPEHTPRLLDLLAAHGAHASFFVVGRMAERHPAVVARILAEGHLLGNHSWSHHHFAQQSLHEQLDELERTDALLSGFDGRSRHRIRPPQGTLPLPLLLALARRRRQVAYWSYNSMDYQVPLLSDLVARLHDKAPSAGDIVLMHDDNELAGAALAELLPRWRAAGHAFRPLPQERA